MEGDDDFVIPLIPSKYVPGDGYGYFRNKKFDDAARVFREELQSLDANTNTYEKVDSKYKMGLSLLYSGSSPMWAVEWPELTLEGNYLHLSVKDKIPFLEAGTKNMGILQEAMGQLREAEECLSLVPDQGHTAHDPRFINITCALGETLAQLGDWPQAYKEYKVGYEVLLKEPASSRDEYRRLCLAVKIGLCMDVEREDYVSYWMKTFGLCEEGVIDSLATKDEQAEITKRVEGLGKTIAFKVRRVEENAELVNKAKRQRANEEKPRRVIHKVLTTTDVNVNQARLNIPGSMVEYIEFLSEAEHTNLLAQPIQATLLDPRGMPHHVTFNQLRKISESTIYVMRGSWADIIRDNKLVEGQAIELFASRVNMGPITFTLKVVFHGKKLSPGTLVNSRHYDSD